MKVRPIAFLLPLFLFAALAAGLASAILRHRASAPGFATHIGRKAPMPALAPIDDAAPQDWQGRAHIVNFFASWCVPCRAEHSALLRLRAADIPLLGIAFKDRLPAIRKFLGEGGDPFAQILNDSDGHAGIDWGLTGIPETFVIDSDGVIRFHQAGPMTEAMVTDEILPLWRQLTR